MSKLDTKYQVYLVFSAHCERVVFKMNNTNL